MEFLVVILAAIMLFVLIFTYSPEGNISTKNLLLTEFGLFSLIIIFTYIVSTNTTQHTNTYYTNTLNLAYPMSNFKLVIDKPVLITESYTIFTYSFNQNKQRVMYSICTDCDPSNETTNMVNLEK